MKKRNSLRIATLLLAIAPLLIEGAFKLWSWGEPQIPAKLNK